MGESFAPGDVLEDILDLLNDPDKHAVDGFVHFCSNTPMSVYQERDFFEFLFTTSMGREIMDRREIDGSMASIANLVVKLMETPHSTHADIIDHLKQKAPRMVVFGETLSSEARRVIDAAVERAQRDATASGKDVLIQKYEESRHPHMSSLFPAAAAAAPPPSGSGGAEGVETVVAVAVANGTSSGAAVAATVGSAASPTADRADAVVVEMPPPSYGDATGALPNTDAGSGRVSPNTLMRGVVRALDNYTEAADGGEPKSVAVDIVASAGAGADSHGASTPARKGSSKRQLRPSDSSVGRSGGGGAAGAQHPHQQQQQHEQHEQQRPIPRTSSARGSALGSTSATTTIRAVQEVRGTSASVGELFAEEEEGVEARGDEEELRGLGSVSGAEGVASPGRRSPVNVPPPDKPWYSMSAGALFGAGRSGGGGAGALEDAPLYMPFPSMMLVMIYLPEQRVQSVVEYVREYLNVGTVNKVCTQEAFLVTFRIGTHRVAAIMEELGALGVGSSYGIVDLVPILATTHGPGAEKVSSIANALGTSSRG